MISALKWRMTILTLQERQEDDSARLILLNFHWGPMQTRRKTRKIDYKELEGSFEEKEEEEEQKKPPALIEFFSNKKLNENPTNLLEQVAKNANLFQYLLHFLRAQDIVMLRRTCHNLLARTNFSSARKVVVPCLLHAAKSWMQWDFLSGYEEEIEEGLRDLHMEVLKKTDCLHCGGRCKVSPLTFDKLCLCKVFSLGDLFPI